MQKKASMTTKRVIYFIPLKDGRTSLEVEDVVIRRKDAIKCVVHLKNRCRSYEENAVFPS